MAWDILPKGNLQYFLQKLKGKLDLKVDAVSGKGLSTNDFTTEEKNKLAGIEAGAQVNPTIDSALSDSSVNAVQNKVVKAALDGKADSEEVPTVNNNTITIQLNGVTVESFKLNQATDETINIQVTKSSVGLGNVPNVSTDDQTPTFTQASARANIASGEKLSVIFGKIMKWFADLKTVAFSGSYNDLSNKPTIPAAVAVKGNAESTYRTGNVNITPANIGLGNVNNTADSNKNVNSANKVNYTKSTSEGTFTYPCEVEGTLSNNEDKIPNSAAVVNYLNSNLLYNVLDEPIITSGTSATKTYTFPEQGLYLILIRANAATANVGPIIEITDSSSVTAINSGAIGGSVSLHKLLYAGKNSEITVKATNIVSGGYYNNYSRVTIILLKKSLYSN